MKKHLSLIVLAVGALVGGCQTRITAEKFPEQVVLIQEKVTVNGEDHIISTGCKIASGGWKATARSPLYSTEALEGLEIGVLSNGTVTMSLSKYQRDLSTNSVVMVKEMFAGGTQLAIAIGDAYCKIAGGGAQASTAIDVSSKILSAFESAGGDVSKATVTTDNGIVKVSDGSVCTTCTADGTCTSSDPSDGASADPHK